MKFTCTARTSQERPRSTVSHSPGWFDPAYINSLRSFATLFVLDRDDGSNGIVAVSAKYHERNMAETPRPDKRLVSRFGLRISLAPSL